jgi:hypothetical protein
MSIRRQREYGASSASMRLRLVDLRLRTMGLFSEPWKLLTNLIFPNMVQPFILDATG